MKKVIIQISNNYQINDKFAVDFLISILPNPNFHIILHNIKITKKITRNNIFKFLNDYLDKNKRNFNFTLKRFPSYDNDNNDLSITSEEHIGFLVYKNVKFLHSFLTYNYKLNEEFELENEYVQKALISLIMRLGSDSLYYYDFFKIDKSNSNAIKITKEIKNCLLDLYLKDKEQI